MTKGYDNPEERTKKTEKKDVMRIRKEYSNNKKNEKKKDEKKNKYRFRRISYSRHVARLFCNGSHC